MGEKAGRQGRGGQGSRGQTFHAIGNYEETVGIGPEPLRLRKNAARGAAHGGCGEHETVILSTQYSRDSAHLFDPDQTPWGDTL